MDAEQRRQRQNRFAQARLAERGEYDPDRGGQGPTRGEYDPDRGEYDPDRGSLGSLYAAGGRSQAATDILRQAVGLGGHLVVAFVSPVGASPVSRPRFRQSRPSELTTAGARAFVTLLIEAKMAARELRKNSSPQANTGATPSTSTQAGQVPPRTTGP